MSDPALLILLVAAAALLLLGAAGALLPPRAAGIAASMLCGGGTLAVIATLLAGVAQAGLHLPGTLPHLALAFALDPLNAPFLLVILLPGTVCTAIAALAGGNGPPVAGLCLVLGGVTLAVLAAGAAPIALGLTAAASGLWRLAPPARPTRPVFAMLAALLGLCLLTPAGQAPAFAAIRDGWAEGATANVALLLALAAGALLLAPLSGRHVDRDAAATGALLPCGIYLLARLLIDLPGPAVQAWPGQVLLLLGALAAVRSGWQAAGDPHLGGAASALARQHAALAVIGLGLTAAGKAADLPDAAALALAAAILLTAGAALAGTLAALAALVMTASAGTPLLWRLGGLLHTMPKAALMLAAALLPLAALPLGSGFAGLWLLFEALLHAPRNGGLLAQVPLALAAAALAASAALAATAALRIAGIALLGRPRSARASAAQDIAMAPVIALAGLAVPAVLAGLLPGPMLRALAEPAVHGLIGIDLGPQTGWLMLAARASTPGYAAMPVLVLLLLTGGCVFLASGRYRTGARPTTVWLDGQPPSASLPFGAPMAQSAGTGFRPRLPAMPLRMPRVPPVRLVWRRSPGARAGLLAILASLSALLLAASLSAQSGL